MSVWKRLWVGLVRLGIAGIIVAFIAGIVAAAYFAAVFPDWTGFGPPLLDAQGQEVPHAKTLWDWLGLLLIPLVLAIGGFFLTRSENREARKIEKDRIEEARKIEEQRAQDAALQAYLDQMTQLLLHEKLPLRTSQPNDEVRSVARARTLTVLRVLDGNRPATVLQFLREVQLIGGIKEEGGVSEPVDPIVSLEGANLAKANLGGATLVNADLDQANLSGANLNQALLAWANLGRANLEGATLKGADLDQALLGGANLRRAHLDEASLAKAYLGGANLEGASLSEAKLPGAKLPGAKLPGANLSGANLSGAILANADLDQANLEGANLEGAYLSGASLVVANLSGANLEGADLTDCKITREQLAQARSLEGAKLPFDMAPPPAPEVKEAAQEDQAKRNV